MIIGLPRANKDIDIFQDIVQVSVECSTVIGCNILKIVSWKLW